MGTVLPVFPKRKKAQLATSASCTFLSAILPIVLSLIPCYYERRFDFSNKILFTNSFFTYSIGPTLGGYSAAYFNNFNILESFHKEAFHSVQRINETIQLGTLHGTNIVYLAKEESDSRVRLVTDPGMQFPAHATAIGKIQLTQYSYDEFYSLYANKELEQPTPYTVNNMDELWEEIEAAKQRGYICEEQEAALGFYCVSAPIYNFENKLLYGISFTMMESGWKTKKEKAIEEIIDLARRLSR